MDEVTLMRFAIGAGVGGMVEIIIELRGLRTQLKALHELIRLGR